MVRKISSRTAWQWILGAALLVGGVSAQEMPEGQSILVTGSGVVYGEPDTALLDLGVNITGEDLAEVSEEANRTMEAVLETLQIGGVEERDIRTTQYNIWREEPYGPEGQPGEPIFRVMNAVRVTVRDVTQVGELLSDAVAAGANMVNGVQYTFSNPTELERQARARAMEDARATAEQLATLADVTILGVEAVSETPTYGGGPVYETRAMAMDMGGEVPVSGGALAVNVTLQVRYSILMNER